MTLFNRGVYHEWMSPFFGTFVFILLLKLRRLRSGKYGCDLFTALLSSPNVFLFVACSSPLEVTPSLCHMVNQPMYCRCDNEDIGGNTIEVSCYITGPLTPSNVVFKSFQNKTSIVSLSFNTFDLSHKLDFVPTDALKHASKVERLQFSESNLGVLKRSSFYGLPKLMWLSLTSNNIVVLEEESIADLPHLRTLDLGHNELSRVPAKVFRKLPSLTQLFLERNHIRWIEDFAFAELVSLKELDLSDNRIVNFTNQTFKGLSEAVRLDLFRNNIQSLGARVFSGMPKLSELDLKYNSISAVDPLAFHGLLQLRFLYISHNELQILPAHLFVGAPNLMGLDLSQNQLLTLTWRTLQDLQKIDSGLLDLNLSGNKFGCDCRLAWIVQLEKTTHSDNLRRELQHVTCSFGQVLSTHGGDNHDSSVRVAKLNFKDLGCHVDYEVPELSSLRRGKGSELESAPKPLAGAFEWKIAFDKVGSDDHRSKAARHQVTLADGPQVASQAEETKWAPTQQRTNFSEAAISSNRDQNCATMSWCSLAETPLLLFLSIFLLSVL